MMKNIHILQTKNNIHSFIFKDINGRLVFNTEWQEIPLGRVNYNVYITSDEIISDVRPYKGRWYLEQGQILNKFPNYLTDLSECKLVILTTDTELIADGVQAIDEDFLKWLVDNPNCEEVEIQKELKAFDNHNRELLFAIENDDYTKVIYKLIIPTQDHKPHSFCETPEDKCSLNYCDENGCQNRKRILVDPTDIDKTKKLIKYDITRYKNSSTEPYIEKDLDYKIEDTNKKLELVLPKGFMNIEISTCNHLIADTNDSANWDTIKIPLPEGKWNIISIVGKTVTLEKIK